MSPSVFVDATIRDTLSVSLPHFRPELALAPRVMEPSPVVRGGRAAKVIVWAAFCTESTRGSSAGR